MNITYISIDWGGSSLNGICLNASNTPITFELPSGNIRSMKEESLTRLCKDLVDIVQNSSTPPFKWLIGAAGAGDKIVSGRLISILNKVAGTTLDIEVYPDFLCNHSSALGGEKGILSINGTGSILYGVNENSALKLGGWGFIFDKTPSGAYFGRKYLEAVLMGLDGHPKFKHYKNDFYERTGEKANRETIIRDTYSVPSTQNHLGKYSKYLTLAYESKEPYAYNCINTSIESLCQAISLMKKELKLENPKICGSGGLWKNWARFESLIKSVCENEKLNLSWQKPKFPLCLGAMHFYSNKNSQLKEILSNISTNLTGI